ncbi:MAG: hypothetical protein ACI35R_17625 [Bacillus sp. (in: firmicutes)]
MEIYSLSGQSGTGKSTSALAFAHQKMIPAIIDDGLLIVNGHKAAGTSAKFEKYALTAVKRATFSDKQHIEEVQAALKRYFIGKILIIGTSDRMTRLIAERLQIGEIHHYFHVEDIRTSSEIKLAQYVRKTEGKHIIPIPYKQVEQNFFKKLIRKGMDILSPKKERIGETTIVFPDFHRGSIQIEKKVFIDLVEQTCLLNPIVTHAHSIHVSLEGEPVVAFHVGIAHPFSFHLVREIEELQWCIYRNFLEYVGIEFTSIDINVESIGRKRNIFIGK